jgi:hypothetical protein
MFGWFKKKETLSLDLTKERGAFITQLAAAVKQFSTMAKSNGSAPFTRVDIKFDLTSEAYPRVWFELDTEPSGEPSTGGSKTYVISERVCGHWARPCHAAMEGKTVTVLGPSGSTKVNNETSLCNAVGLFFVELTKSMRKAELFSSLPRSAKCYLGVSTEDGEYGWPAYEDRGPDNML